MDKVNAINGIEVSELKIIEGADGKVMHALKNIDPIFMEFGEAYFSTVNFQKIKGWKMHTKMVSNLIVPVGEVQFVFFDDRPESKTKGSFFDICLSQKNYVRLTVQPGLWMAFKGKGKDTNLILNIASICHDPAECLNDPMESTSITYSF